jgi:hypothetical protein
MLSNPDPASDEWLAPKAVAEELGVSTRTLANQRYMGTGPDFSKLGPGRFAPVRYRRSDLQLWIRSETRATSTADQ